MFNTPTNQQLTTIIDTVMPKITNDNNVIVLTEDKNTILLNNVLNYIQNDLRKLLSIYEIYTKNFEVLKNNQFLNIFQPKSYNEDTKITTQKLISNRYNIADHNILMNETDRTIVGLLWHENIIEILNKISKKSGILLYLKFLENICFADNIDRITFQKQIWQFNEMSSLVKIFYNNHIFHNYILQNQHLNKHMKLTIPTIRFTKVLTKYSTEYNNAVFIQNLCQTLNMDKKDIFSFFIKLKPMYDSGEIYPLFEPYELTKLDINRIYRYIDRRGEVSGGDLNVNA